MRVSTSWDDGQLDLCLRLDDGERLDGEGQAGMPIRLVANTTTIRHPALSADTHPDLVALAVILTVAPWVGRRLWLDEPVSAGFAGAIQRGFGFEVGPVDEDLRSRAQGQHVGLLYSGGVDSVALSEFIPPDSPLIHLRRVRHPRVPNRATHLRVDVSEHYARLLQAPDRPLEVVTADVEFLCQPFPTYPTWVTLGIGAVLLADHLNLGAVAAGFILGARHLDEGRKFDADGDNARGWYAAFEAAGIPLFGGMAGATEILTFQLVEEAGLEPITRSCQLGTVEAPCWNCIKCLRKELIASAFVEEPLPTELVDRVSANPKIVDPLLGPPPYYQQHILEYVLARVPGTDATFLKNAKDRLRPTRDSTDWVERYYPPALEQIPEPWQDRFKAQLLDSVDLMSEDDVAIVEGWDAAKRVHPSSGYGSSDTAGLQSRRP